MKTKITAYMQDKNWFDVERIKKDFYFKNDSQVIQRSLAAVPSREFLHRVYKGTVKESELREWALRELQILTGNIDVEIGE